MKENRLKCLNLLIENCMFGDVSLTATVLSFGQFDILVDMSLNCTCMAVKMTIRG